MQLVRNTQGTLYKQRINKWWQWHIMVIYKGCLESIQPFWISRETVAWPWC